MYEDTPLENIPWQHTQADWFKELLNSGKITGKTALDLGCGTGVKALQLSEVGFQKVTAIDISPMAIEHAKANALKKGVGSVEFIASDASDLSVLGDQKFDFILDWAALHCIPQKDRKKYVSGVIGHSHPGTLFLLRTFAKTDGNESFIDDRGHAKTRIYLFDNNDIAQLFGGAFEVIKANHSKPRTHANRSFNEYLMRRT